MNIRQAILAAADQIARNPSGFQWQSTDVPRSSNCGTPGCALGWIGCFAQPEARFDWERALNEISLGTVAVNALGLRESMEFYNLMEGCSRGDWRKDAESCAKTLRAYADKYHPAESHAPIPASVRAIFDMTPAELAREIA